MKQRSNPQLVAAGALQQQQQVEEVYPRMRSTASGRLVQVIILYVHVPMYVPTLYLGTGTVFFLWSIAYEGGVLV